jgi:hypothetical protein
VSNEDPRKGTPMSLMESFSSLPSSIIFRGYGRFQVRRKPNASTMRIQFMSSSDNKNEEVYIDDVTVSAWGN